VWDLPTLDGRGRQSIWDAAKEAKKAGHDGIVVTNTLDSPAFEPGGRFFDKTPRTVMAALEKGTVFDTAGNQVFANASDKAGAASMLQRELDRLGFYSGALEQAKKLPLFANMNPALAAALIAMRQNVNH